MVDVDQQAPPQPEATHWSVSQPDQDDAPFSAAALAYAMLHNSALVLMLI